MNTKKNSKKFFPRFQHSFHCYCSIAKSAIVASLRVYEEGPGEMVSQGRLKNKFSGKLYRGKKSERKTFMNKLFLPPCHHHRRSPSSRARFRKYYNVCWKFKYLTQK